MRIVALLSLVIAFGSGMRFRFCVRTGTSHANHRARMLKIMARPIRVELEAGHHNLDDFRVVVNRVAWRDYETDVFLHSYQSDGHIHTTLFSQSARDVLRGVKSLVSVLGSGDRVARAGVVVPTRRRHMEA